MRKATLFIVPVLCLLAGCSSKFVMPWEKDQLDPSRIATREPLEIPPDLDVLPTNEPPEDTVGTRQSDRDTLPASARSILFKTQEKPQTEKPPLNRDEQEKLPNWLTPSRGSK
ncbi:MAG: hypothetical protein HQL94_05175 [Magnetococcales bacterium]|nr:hypothetical protein [Magnetococcales bacterium]MBF0439238.1 hypothetical protein [Magnetococcales bacterium]